MTTEYQITVEPLGREVTCREDQTILDACLRAGVWIPHSCTHGTCATCKAEVLEGEVDQGEASSFALMDFERDEGKTLPCVARPRSDVVIEADVDVDESIPVHPVSDYVGTLVQMTEVANDTRRLVIELDRDIAFNAGQYMALSVPGHDGLTRTYSMANPPSEPRRLEFQIRRTAGGLATDGWIFAGLAVGDTIRLAGPYGRFVLREDRSEPAIMIAGGTGLAPIASMIRHALEDGIDEVGCIWLYQGARTREWMYDVDRFRALEAEFPDRFRYRPCLSEETADGFASGMVTDVLNEEHETLKGHVGYVCGPPAMVEAALKTLMLKRLFPRDIFKEEFLDASAAATQVRSPLIKR
jgi:phenol/toluene 2-monooxygenase (NADH) P5/A5